jgi:hypothetical protein
LSDDLPQRVVVEKGVDLPDIAVALPLLRGWEQLDRETMEQMPDGLPRRSR